MTQKRNKWAVLFLIGLLFGLNQGLLWAKAPEIKLAQKVTEIKIFDSYLVHPDRYVLSHAKEGYAAPAFYDLKTGQITQWPSLYSLEGLPRQTRDSKTKLDPYAISGLKLAGEYFSWYRLQVVAYDPEKNHAGILLTKVSTKKKIEGTPQCQNKSETAELIVKYNRYYCRQSKAYIPESEYMTDIYEYFYASAEPQTGKILSISPLKLDISNPNEQLALTPLGYDAQNQYFYYANSIYFYKSQQSSGQIQIYRFNIKQNEIDWEMKVKIPVRKKENAPLTYSLKHSVNLAVTQVVFFEYDESMNEKGRNGFLENPEAQAFVVNLKEKTSFAFQAPLTAYGQAFDQNNDFLAMVSNQTGKIHLIDLKAKKQVKVIQGDRSVFHALFTKNNQYLFVFTKSTLAIYAASNLKLVKKMPISAYIPGVKMLLTADTAISMDSGALFFTGNFKKTEGGDWWVADAQDGFSIYRITD